jgi:hypothetical protein
VAPLETVKGSPAAFGPFTGKNDLSIARKPGANSGDNAADFCVQSPTPNAPNGADCIAP